MKNAIGNLIGTALKLSDFPGEAVVMNPPANAGDLGGTGYVGLIPGSRRSLGVGNGNPL